jgi:hypothetical protein
MDSCKTKASIGLLSTVSVAINSSFTFVIHAAEKNCLTDGRAIVSDAASVDASLISTSEIVQPR